jgi:hypothetical protein
MVQMGHKTHQDVQKRMQLAMGRQVTSDNILTEYLKSVAAEASTGMNHLLLFWFMF